MTDTTEADEIPEADSVAEDDFWPKLSDDAAAEFDRMRRDLRDPSPHQPLPEPGDVIDGRYEVIRHLGAGGFGCVFEVNHAQLERRFALKVLTPHVAHRAGWAARFREEARATSQIGHPNIVFITDFGSSERFGDYFVMEHLDGLTLAEVLASGPLTLDQTVELARAAGAGLDAAHDREIVHCDLKPGNIFRVGGAERPRWKLLDFGASSIVMSAVETHTVYGTPRYMAPEHAVGGAVDRRADVFSLGVVIYEAIAEQGPWDTRNWYQATRQWRSEHPPRRPSEISAAPASWDDVILRAIAVSPDDRYATAGEFADALATAGRSQPRPIEGATLGPSTTIELNRGASFRRSLSPGEFFVISRIEEKVTLGELNRLCTGLPFDINETVQSMAARGYVVLESESTPRDVRKPLPPRRTEPRPGLSETSEKSEVIDVDALFVHIERLRERGNFLGALETLRSALTTWPEVASLHHRYGLLLREFGREPEARASLKRAADLEPSNLEYRRAAHAETDG